jgi:hypothetical protein
MSAFSDAITAIGKLTPAEREFLLIELAKLVQYSRGGESPIHIADQNGTTVGYLFPPEPHPTTPPVLSPEEEEDLRQRFETPDDVLTTEELKALIRQGAPATTSKS